MTSPQPQPHPAPSFVPAGRPPASPNPPSPQPGDSSFTYTVIAPGPMRPAGPPASPPGQRPMVQPQHRPSAITPQVTRVLIAGASLIAVVLGVTLPGALGSGWDAFLAWSIFAVVCALAVLAGGATEHRIWSWQLQLYGTIGLLLTWLIAGWPIAVSNVGFLLTLGVALGVLSTLRSPFRPPWRAVFSPRGPARR